MVTFYAFCRVIDDIADDSTLPAEERRSQLERWKTGILQGFANPDELQVEVGALSRRYPIEPSWLCQIIEGVASDLDHQRYERFEDLLAYCYKVASVVGLVSIEIFGYKNPGCRDYAVHLGYALQLTNIIRDVGEDARESGRIYLPLEDLRRFGVQESDILQRRYTSGFHEMMLFQSQRAFRYYDKANLLLPDEDRQNMMPAEIMSQVYGEILHKIQRNGFRVFDRRFGLSKLRKITILAGYALRGILKAV